MFNRKSLLLAIPLPLALLAVWMWMAAARGPFHLGTNSDPDYAYLVNAAGLLELHPPNLSDHPGTPPQVAEAAVILGTWIFIGQGSPADDALQRPELYLTAANRVFALATALILFFAGVFAFHLTRSLPVLYCIQAAPFLSMQSLYPLATVRPETILLPVALLFGLWILWLWHDPARLDRPAAAHGFAILVGLGVASKITFAPLALFPLLLLPTRRLRMRYILAAAIAFLIFIAPILVRAWQIGRWYFNLITHTGHYGSGERGFVNVATLGTTFKTLLLAEPALPLFALVGLILVFVTRAAVKDARTTLLWRATLALSVVELAQLIFVAKHPNAHYLLPALALLGTHAACFYLLLRETTGVRGAYAAIVATLTIALVAAFPATRERRTQLAATQIELNAFLKRVDEKTRGGVTVQYYRCSAIPYALKFGNDFCGDYFAPRLEARHPDSFFYDIWKKKYSTYTTALTPAELREKAAARPIYFWGTHLSQYPPDIWPEGFTFEQIDAAGAETLYRATPK